MIPDKKILDHLAGGVSDLIPDHAEALWEETVPPADGTEWFLDSTTPRHQKTVKRRYAAGAIAACLALFLVSSLCFHLMPSASVYLDVNPSVQLDVNYRDRVTKAIPCNEDAEVILGDMDLNGTDLDVALYAILGSMVHHGYLTEETNTILVSVQSSNTDRADELEAEVDTLVSQNLDTLIHGGEVLSHQIQKEDRDQDASSSCTPGKLSFIEDLKAQYPQLKQTPLETMTMNEIVSLLDEMDLDYSDYHQDDDDNDEIEDDLDDDLNDIDDDDESEGEEDDDDDFEEDDD